MRMIARSICACVCCVLLLIGTIGCGGGPSSINGKVTYKGVPVTGGNITFDFGGDKKVPAMIDSNGAYAIQTAHTGKAKVTIETETLKGASALAPLPQNVADKEKLPQMPGGTAAYMKIPAKYADSNTTDLTLDVKSGTNPKNFDLMD